LFSYFWFCSIPFLLVLSPNWTMTQAKTFLSIWIVFPVNEFRFKTALTIAWRCMQEGDSVIKLFLRRKLLKTPEPACGLKIYRQEFSLIKFTWFLSPEITSRQFFCLLFFLLFWHKIFHTHCWLNIFIISWSFKKEILGKRTLY